MAGQPEAAPRFGPCCSCTVKLNTWCLFSSLVSHTPWWGWQQVSSWFRLNILKLIQKWQGSSSSFGEIYRYIFVRLMSLCKSVCFIRGRDERPCVCVERARQGQCDATNVPVCLSACFCGLVNPRTVPQLSLIKFRAPLGYRGLVLGLNVSISFFLWVFPMEHVQSKLDQQKSPTVTKNCGQCWPFLDTCLCACVFFCCDSVFRCIPLIQVFLGVSGRWRNITGQISCTVT